MDKQPLDEMLEEVVDPGVFNATVHKATKSGDPDRKDDGTIKLRADWKTKAVDRQGRTYNKHVHGDKQELDREGFLKVRRRDVQAAQSNTSRTEALVAKYYEKGYAYYIFNDDGGRLEWASEHDWEPVLDKESGAAGMNVGQARGPNTQARLFRKPMEWYEADQNAKIARNKARYEETTSPKEEDGQYRADESSPLR